MAMKRMKIFLFCLVSGATIHAGSFSPFASLFMSSKPQEASLATHADLAKKQRERLEKEFELLESPEHRTRLEQARADSAIFTAKSQKATRRDKSFSEQKLSLHNQYYQLLNEIDGARQQLRLIIEQHLDLLKKIANDPEFKNGTAPVKTSYSLGDLDSEKLLTLKTRLADFEKLKLTTAEDVAKRRRALSALIEELRVREQDREEFAQSRREEESNGMTRLQRAELLDDQARVFNAKRELAELKLKEAEFKAALVDTELYIVRNQKIGAEKDYARIKRDLIVDTEYVQRSKETLELRRKESVERSEQFHDRMRMLVGLKSNVRQRIEKFLKQHDLESAEISQLREWTREPHSIAQWHTTCVLGNLITQEEFFASEHEFLEARVEFEKAKFRNEEIIAQIVSSWHKITQRRHLIDTAKELEREIKLYDLPKAELQVELAALIEKRNAAIGFLQKLNTLFDRMKTLSTALREKRESLFNGSANEYNQCAALLYESEDLIRRRIDLTAKLVETYSATIVTVGDMLKRIEGVLGELTSKSFWRRSHQSIEWSELKYFSPELKRFGRDVRMSMGRYFLHGQLFTSLAAGIRSFADYPLMILVWLVRILVLILAFIIVRYYVADFCAYLARAGTEFTLFAPLFAVVAIFLDYVTRHIGALYGWLAIFTLIKGDFITDEFFAILFYLLSIPLVIAFAYGFFKFFLEVNARRGYAYISHSYQRRFTIIVPTLVYASTTLYLIREAFVLANYADSHVPVILLGINFILGQMALISLLSKEQVLSMIPDDTPLWEWIKEHVDRYYHVLLVIFVAIIVMSNPYVGYGRQVLYVASRILMTALLIPLLAWVYNRLKRVLSDLFFYYSDGEVLKERFPTGKSFYGATSVAALFALFAIGIIIASRLWNHPVTLRDMAQALQYTIYRPGIDEATGKAIEVSLLSFLQVFAFVVIGITIANFFNRYILQKIFDPLLVGSGVQNTISILSRYVIIFAALFIGLQFAGLDSIALKLGIIIGGLAVVMREPIADFISYFIILVQRPIKIGDLIMIAEGANNELMGVVRHITPRSTIVRRRNSVSLIVPNSHIVNKIIYNWSYTRTFCAFDDILLTIPYSADPKRAQQLIIKTLEENVSILKNPAPIVFLRDFTDNGFQFQVRGYLTADKVLDQWEIASNVRLELVRRLREAGMDIASPTRVLKISGDLPKL